MVYRSPALDATFFALADPTRRAILTRLAHGDRTISELASRFDMSLPAVSKHVRVLQGAGLARVQRQGRVRRASLSVTPLRSAMQWIARYRRFWESELDLLAAYLEHPSAPEHPWPSKPPPSRPSKSAASLGRRGSASSTRGRNRKK